MNLQCFSYLLFSTKCSHGQIQLRNKVSFQYLLPKPSDFSTQIYVTIMPFNTHVQLLIQPPIDSTASLTKNVDFVNVLFKTISTPPNGNRHTLFSQPVHLTFIGVPELLRSIFRMFQSFRLPPLVRQRELNLFCARLLFSQSSRKFLDCFTIPFCQRSKNKKC